LISNNKLKDSHMELDSLTSIPFCHVNIEISTESKLSLFIGNSIVDKLE